MPSPSPLHGTSDVRVDRTAIKVRYAASLPPPLPLSIVMPSSVMTSSSFLRRVVLNPSEQLCGVLVAERWVSSVRREMHDYVIPLKERHLRRLGLE